MRIYCIGCFCCRFSLCCCAHTRSRINTSSLIEFSYKFLTSCDWLQIMLMLNQIQCEMVSCVCECECSLFSSPAKHIFVDVELKTAFEWMNAITKNKKSKCRENKITTTIPHQHHHDDDDGIWTWKTLKLTIRWMHNTRPGICVAWSLEHTHVLTHTEKESEKFWACG